MSDSTDASVDNAETIDILERADIVALADNVEPPDDSTGSWPVDKHADSRNVVPAIPKWSGKLPAQTKRQK